MDLTSTVRSDTLPAVGSFLVPGAVAATPFVALVWGQPHDLKAFVDANQGVSTAAAALLVVAIGLLVESVGSYAEFYWIDRQHKNREEMLNVWREYLQIAWQTEPVGQHYLRRILTIFKFELNLLVATLATIPGTVLLGWWSVLPWHGFVWLLLITFCLAWYLYVASVASSRLLAELRQGLVAQARAINKKTPEEGTVLARP
jgi:hypothetical protein